MLVLDKRLAADAASPVAGHLQLDLYKPESQFLITFQDGHVLGELNAQLEKALTNIEEQQLLLEYEVFVPSRATRDTISRAMKGKEAIIRVQVNLYGPLSSADSVGQELSLNKIWLQRPDYVRDSVAYANPHVLKFADDCDPLPKAASNVEEPSNSKARDEALQQVIGDVYSSLTRNQNLKGLEGHERLLTPLLK
jgi:SWI/SNF-related matrix-associated actin-dependent regulator of chromatin subfamily A3